MEKNVARVFFVVEGEAQVLQLVVHLVAQVIGDQLGEGIREAGAGEIEYSPEDTEQRQRPGKPKQRGFDVAEICYRSDLVHPVDVLGGHDQLVNAVAEEPGYRQGKEDCDEECGVCEYEPGPVLPRYQRDSPQNAQLCANALSFGANNKCLAAIRYLPSAAWQ